jgi:N-acylneuraminate cytidylyltransferase
MFFDSRKLFFVFVTFPLVSWACDKPDVCYDKISNSSKAITALILARGGSKGIKLKNIQRIDGVSLLGISLTALQEVKRFNSIWVSTDHEEIAAEAEKCELNFNVEVRQLKEVLSDNVNVHWRDPKTAQDTSTSIESVQEFLKNHPKVSNLALIQCTSPFINRNYLKEAIKAFLRRHCTFSVFRSFKLRWSHDEDTNQILPINFDYKRRPRRQDWGGKTQKFEMKRIK